MRSSILNVISNCLESIVCFLESSEEQRKRERWSEKERAPMTRKIREYITTYKGICIAKGGSCPSKAGDLERQPVNFKFIKSRSCAGVRRGVLAVENVRDDGNEMSQNHFDGFYCNRKLLSRIFVWYRFSLSLSLPFLYIIVCGRIFVRVWARINNSLWLRALFDSRKKDKRDKWRNLLLRT